MSESPLYQSLFEQSPDGIATVDPETARIERVNPAYADILGTDPEALEGRSFVERLIERTSADRATLDRGLDTACQGSSLDVECTVERGTGRGRPVALTLSSLEDQRTVLSTLRWGRERSERDLPDVEMAHRLDVALTGTDTGVWEWDMAKDEVIWTESMERLFGLEAGTFEGTFEAFAKRVHSDDRPAVTEAIETAVEREELFQIEYRIRRDDGETRWVYARGEIHETDDGAGRIVGVVTDITQQKEQEQVLHRQERQYRELVDRLPEAYYTFDSDWTMTYCNEVIADRFETTVEEMLGETIRDIYPEIEDTVLEAAFRTVMETQESATCEYYVEEYGYWVEAQVYPYEDGIAVISSDITERKEKMTMVLDTMPLIFFQIDTDGTFLESRGKGLSKLGLEPNEAVGLSLFELYSEEPAIIEAAERALDGESISAMIEHGTDHFQTHFRPIVENGEVTSAIGVSMDVSALERQREQMEFFNSILRHDVLNGMTVIKTRGQILAEQLDGEQARYAKTIVDWCNTTTEITQRVQRVIETLTTPDEDLRVESIDLTAILDRKLDELRTAHPEIEFMDAVPRNVSVRGDELLADVLGNVLLNSIEHNDSDGLTIDVTLETDDSVVLRIADSGVGIDEERRESVFRRGETSHAKETGSGFGLFFVDVMVDKYGGDVWVEESDLGGACFALDLPRARAEAQQ
ncbi:PAS domain-containing sensor histidine kinase [Halovivax gelatinilyticus]|uniref:PAS domain-containing sensor histidine kinase n=1 Tax=Halovivax gelatinilyticus TaxID=2961597 RepID=UPI0020CA807D|nr:PAS domain-containing protein [Halovivax gelatinilyticus]